MQFAPTALFQFVFVHRRSHSAGEFIFPITFSCAILPLYKLQMLLRFILLRSSQKTRFSLLRSSQKCNSSSLLRRNYAVKHPFSFFLCPVRREGVTSSCSRSVLLLFFLSSFIFSVSFLRFLLFVFILKKERDNRSQTSSALCLLLCFRFACCLAFKGRKE